MDDLKPIVYIFFVVIYVISRVMKGAKKLKEQGHERPVEQTPPPVRMPPTPVFTEVKRTVQKPMPEIKRKVFIPEKKPVKSDNRKRELMPGSIETTEPLTAPIEKFEKEVGFSSLSKKMKLMFSEEKQEEPAAFEFDPRQAFMMKTLLDRHPLV